MFAISAERRCIQVTELLKSISDRGLLLFNVYAAASGIRVVHLDDSHACSPAARVHLVCMRKLSRRSKVTQFRNTLTHIVAVSLEIFVNCIQQ